MKRSPIARRTPLERGPAPKRRTQVRRVNAKRKVRLHEEQFGPEGYAGWIRSLACCVSGDEGTEWDPIVFAHGKSRGAGGDWRTGVPMRATLHAEQHSIGIETFQRKYDVSLEAIAHAHVQRWAAFTR